MGARAKRFLFRCDCDLTTGQPRLHGVRAVDDQFRHSFARCLTRSLWRDQVGSANREIALASSGLDISEAVAGNTSRRKLQIEAAQFGVPVAPWTVTGALRSQILERLLCEPQSVGLCGFRSH